MPRHAGVVTILAGPGKRPWTSDGFEQAWARSAKRNPALAGLHFHDLQVHDLRGTAVTRLSGAGCGTQPVAAVTGHSHAGYDRGLDVYLARTRTWPRVRSRRSKNTRRNFLQNALQNRTRRPS